MKILTVVICTYNRSKHLYYALQSIVDQTCSQEYFNVIVIDNNSKDSTKQIVNNFSDKLPIGYFLEKKQGLSHARNRGIREARTDYIAFLDDDAKADKKWLSTALEIIDSKKPAIFGGPIYPFYLTTKPKWFLDEYEIRKLSNHSRYFNQENKYLSGSNIFFKKNVFNQIGLFNVNLGMKGRKISMGEEVKLQIIANKKKISRYYDPDLKVYHLVPGYKMKISYITKRVFSFGYCSRSIFQNRKNSFAMGIFELILRLVKFFLDIIRYPFRNKKKFPYWQNYFLVITRKIVVNSGKLFSYIKPIK